MNHRLTALACAIALAAPVALPGAALAQEPLSVIVRPLTVPGRILAAPFGGFDSNAPGVYNPAPAKAAAVGYKDDFTAIVPVEVLRQTGPRSRTPDQGERTALLGPGSEVPNSVVTAPLENVSVRGLNPNAEYDFFVAPDQRTVIVDPNSRRVVRILP